MRRCGFLILFIFIAIMLSGCFDAREVTEWAYVYSIGWEKGVTNKLRMTVQIASMKGEGTSSQNGGGQSTDKIETISLDCTSFYSGVNLLNTFVSRQTNYMHAKYIVFSEDLAREGLDNYINGFARGRQVDRNAIMIVTKGSAKDFLLENLPVISSSLSKKQQNMMEQSGNTGLFPQATYGNLISDVKAPYYQPIAILAAVNDYSGFHSGKGSSDIPFKTGSEIIAGMLPRTGGGRVEFLGTAVFDGAKMVDTLNGDETRAMLMARDEFKRGFYVLKDPRVKGKTITMDVRRQKKPDISVKFENEMPRIEVKVFLEGDINSIQSTVDYEDPKLKPELEAAMKEQINKDLTQTIKKCQEVNSDVFKFGLRAVMHFFTIQDWEQYNWLGKFKEAKVTTNVEFAVRRTGTMLKSNEIWSSEGKQEESKK